MSSRQARTKLVAQPPQAPDPYPMPRAMNRFSDPNYTPYYGRERLIVKSAADITPENTNWVIPGYIAEGELQVIAGDPATGKTGVIVNFVARVSNENINADFDNWPDGGSVMHGKVLIMNNEDDVKSVLVARLLAANANLANVHFLEGFRDFDRTRPLSFSLDKASIDQTFARIGNVKLLVIDNLNQALLGFPNTNAGVRAALEPVIDLMKRHRCATLGVTHFTKNSEGKNSLDRVVGSLAITAVARGVMAIRKISCHGPNEQQQRFALEHAKASHAKGLVYSIVGAQVPSASGSISTMRIQWHGPICDNEMDDVNQEKAKAKSMSNARSAAKNFLADALAKGPVFGREIEAKAKAAGISRRSLEHAKRDLCVESYKQPNAGQLSRFLWRLPTSDSVQTGESVVAQIPARPDINSTTPTGQSF